MSKQDLAKEIELQKEKNVELYDAIPLPSYQNPTISHAEPYLDAWRAGSRRLHQLLAEYKEKTK